jgi:hypothetical protein
VIRHAGDDRPREIALEPELSVCVEGLSILAWLQGRLPRCRDV